MLPSIIHTMVCNPLLSLDELSKKLGISRKKVQILIRSEAGTGFRRAMNVCKLSHSVRLLSSGFSVKQVAIDSGYTYPENFSRALKKHFGFLPTDTSALNSFMKTNHPVMISNPYLCPHNNIVCDTYKLAIAFMETIIQ
jgi:AraC-like DNA-binding protein